MSSPFGALMAFLQGFPTLCKMHTALPCFLPRWWVLYGFCRKPADQKKPLKRRQKRKREVLSSFRFFLLKMKISADFKDGYKDVVNKQSCRKIKIQKVRVKCWHEFETTKLSNAFCRMFLSFLSSSFECCWEEMYFAPNLLSRLEIYLAANLPISIAASPNAKYLNVKY